MIACVNRMYIDIYCKCNHMKVVREILVCPIILMIVISPRQNPQDIWATRMKTRHCFINS